MDKHIVAKMLGVDVLKGEQDILDRLAKKLTAAESAGIYKAQADFWMEHYQTLRKECLRVINRGKGLERLNEILDGDLDAMLN